MRRTLTALVLCSVAWSLAYADPRPSSADDVTRALGGDYWRPKAERSAPVTANRRATDDKRPAYLYDLLRDADHQFAYQRMLADAYVLPRWFRKFNQDGDGVGLPVEIKTIQGRRYEFAQVCKPRDATGSCVLIVFDTGTDEGSVAWGLIRDDDGSEWIGIPPPAVKRIAEAFEPS